MGNAAPGVVTPRLRKRVIPTNIWKYSSDIFPCQEGGGGRRRRGEFIRSGFHGMQVKSRLLVAISGLGPDHRPRSRPPPLDSERVKWGGRSSSGLSLHHVPHSLRPSAWAEWERQAGLGG